MDRALDAVPDVVSAFLSHTAIGRAECVSKVWASALRAAPASHGVWAEKLGARFFGAGPALLGAAPAGAPFNVARRAYRGLLRARATAGRRCVDVGWDDGGGARERRAPLDEGAIGVLVVAGPYAGFARWGGRDEFPRESDPDEFEPVWNPNRFKIPSTRVFRNF